jgi:hypothetical protein
VFPQQRKHAEVGPNSATDSRFNACSASYWFLFLSSHDGVSGKQDMPSINVNESTHDSPNEVRHPLLSLLVLVLTTNAVRMPIVSMSWYSEFNIPRTDGGDISAVYIGTTQLKHPTPSPATIRPNTIVPKPFDDASINAPTCKVSERTMTNA